MREGREMSLCEMCDAKCCGEQVGNINDFSATDAKDGQSTATLDVGSLAETKMFRVVRVAEDPKNEDATAAGCNVIAVMNGAANLFINGRDS